MISSQILLGIRNVSEKLWRKSKHMFMFNNFFFSKNHAVYEIMWENRIETDRPQMAV